MSLVDYRPAPHPELVFTQFLRCFHFTNIFISFTCVSELSSSVLELFFSQCQIRPY
jgi:hypothetical protein